MNTINIATLKGKLSHYLKLVQEGQEIVVTSHRHPVARLLPIAAPSLNQRKPSRPVSDLLSLRNNRPHPRASAVDALIQDRRRR